MKLGFSGLMIESHIRPCDALSDAAQQITPEEVGQLLRSLPAPKTEGADDHTLQSLRERIDTLDSELLQVLAKRMEACREIGLYKQQEDMPVVQPDRYASLLGDKIAEGGQLGLDPAFLRRLFSEIHAASVDLQLNLSQETK